MMQRTVIDRDYRLLIVIEAQLRVFERSGYGQLRPNATASDVATWHERVYHRVGE